MIGSEAATRLPNQVLNALELIITKVQYRMKYDRRFRFVECCSG